MEVVKPITLKERVLKIQSLLPRRNYVDKVKSELIKAGHSELAKAENIKQQIYNVVALKKESEPITKALEAVAGVTAK